MGVKENKEPELPSTVVINKDVYKIHYLSRRFVSIGVSSTLQNHIPAKSYGSQIELDTHANTNVFGNNNKLFSYKGKFCGLYMYEYYNEEVIGVLIFTRAT